MAIPPEQTRAEADFLQKVLQTQESSHILDVPCGNGRHSIELAKRGLRVTGVDISEEFIEEATAAGKSLAATFLQIEMRSLPWEGEFDGAFCFGNSMGFFDADSTRQFLAAVARTLKPKARFVIDTGMAAESILPGLQSKRWYKIGDLYMLSENQYHPREGRLDIQYTFIRDGITVTRPTSSYVLTANEICRMHEEAGLKPLDLLASIAGEPYERGSQRLILVSEKQ